MLGWSVQPRQIAMFLTTLTLLVGCDSDSFTPPPPPGLRPSGVVAGAVPTRVKEIVMILPAVDTDDLARLESLARLDAGTLQVVFRSVRPRTADAQADLIRRAIADGASALIVVPDDSKSTAEAVAEVDQAKTPIVLMGKPLAGGSTDTASTLVTFPDFKESAGKIVAAIAEDAKSAGFPDDAPIVVLKLDPPDWTSRERSAALLDAVKASGHPIASTILVANPPEEAGKALESSIRANPGLCAVVADSEEGVNLAGTARQRFGLQGRFLIGGYIINRSNASYLSSGQHTVQADRNLDVLARTAVLTAIDRASGRAMPGRVEVELPVRRAKQPFVPIKPVDPAEMGRP